MKKSYKAPEMTRTEFETEDITTISMNMFDTEGIEDYGDSGGIG